MRITKLSEKGLNLLKQFEKFEPKPYLDTGKVPTIGYGTTYYPDGTRVRMTDTEITEEKATEYMLANLVHYEQAVDSFTRDDINQNQFDALVCFAYNVGTQSLKRSTLLKKVNIDPNDPTIANEFRKWVYDNGRRIQGLLNRREKEIKLYYGL